MNMNTNQHTAQIPQAVYVVAIRLGARTNTGYPLLDESNRNKLTEMKNTLTASGYSAEEMDKFNSLVSLAINTVKG